MGMRHYGIYQEVSAIEEAKFRLQVVASPDVEPWATVTSGSNVAIRGQVRL